MNILRISKITMLKITPRSRTENKLTKTNHICQFDQLTKVINLFPTPSDQFLASWTHVILFRFNNVRTLVAQLMQFLCNSYAKFLSVSMSVSKLRKTMCGLLPQTYIILLQGTGTRRLHKKCVRLA